MSDRAKQLAVGGKFKSRLPQKGYSVQNSGDTSSPAFRSFEYILTNPELGDILFTGNFTSDTHMVTFLLHGTKTTLDIMKAFPIGKPGNGIRLKQ